MWKSGGGWVSSASYSIWCRRSEFTPCHRPVRLCLIDHARNPSPSVTIPWLQCAHVWKVRILKHCLWTWLKTLSMKVISGYANLSNIDSLSFSASQWITMKLCAGLHGPRRILILVIPWIYFLASQAQDPHIQLILWLFPGELIGWRMNSTPLLRTFCM